MDEHPSRKEMLVRAAGIEPARLTAADFKSDASTNFAMPAAAKIVLRHAASVLAAEHDKKMPLSGEDSG